MSRMLWCVALLAMLGCEESGTLVGDPVADGDGDGWTPDDGDCDDADPAVHPDADEIPCDEVDNDCDDGTPDDPGDADGDGFDACGGDCDDGDADVNPDGVEICDGDADEDCDGSVDEDCVVEEFEQTTSNATDMLWVVDNSCSMTEEQGHLGMQFEVLYDALTAAGVEYRIAVVTTDNPAFHGEPPYIGPHTHDALEAFAASVSVGTAGSGTERGLMFGHEALALAADDTPPNDGYFRDDAGLQVVFVSDEADQSGDWSNWVEQYLALKHDPSVVYLNAITGTDGVDAVDCSGFGGTAYAGTGYVDAAHATGGLLVSICDTDWSTLMADLASQTQQIAGAFPLSEVPIVETLGVTVDGVHVTSGWAYDAEGNAVVFDGAHVPQVGAVVVIAYQVAG